MNDLQQFPPNIRAKIVALRREHKEACDRVARCIGCKRFSNLSARQIGRIPTQVMRKLGQIIEPIIAQLQEIMGQSPAASTLPPAHSAD
jgi:serine kinase of HPr protein (carbohydrate metabolism regulator)